jgi:hypothetical protein
MDAAAFIRVKKAERKENKSQYEREEENTK